MNLAFAFLRLSMTIAASDDGGAMFTLPLSTLPAVESVFTTPSSSTAAPSLLSTLLFDMPSLVDCENDTFLFNLLNDEDDANVFLVGIV